jgi:hypothetical protein
MAKNLIGNFSIDSNKSVSINVYRTAAVQKGTGRFTVNFEDNQIISASEITERDDVDFSSLINDEIFFTVLGKNLNFEVGTETFEGAHVYADARAPVLISGGGNTIFSQPISPTTKKSNFFYTEIEGAFQYSASDYLCEDIISFNVIDTYSYNIPLGTAEVEPTPFWN